MVWAAPQGSTMRCYKALDFYNSSPLVGSCPLRGPPAVCLGRRLHELTLERVEKEVNLRPTVLSLCSPWVTGDPIIHSKRGEIYGGVDRENGQTKPNPVLWCPWDSLSVVLQLT